jgi:hypothetical protein
LPPIDVIERMAWAMSGVIGKAAEGGMLAKVPAHFLMRDGSTCMTEALAHPDPDAQAVLAATCDAELVQGDGRPRPVRRTPERPLDIFLLTDVPLPLEIDRLVTSEEALADAHEARWMVASGVVPVLGTHGARGFLAEVLGMEPNAVRVMLHRDPTWAEEFGAVRSPCTNAIRKNSLMANVHSEEADCASSTSSADEPDFSLFRVKLKAEDRYAAQVLIRATSVAEAKARLLKVAISDTAEIEMAAAPAAAPDVDDWQSQRSADAEPDLGDMPSSGADGTWAPIIEALVCGQPLTVPLAGALPGLQIRRVVRSAVIGTLS